ncbi:3-hydroxyacyl-CoA dehydrogenase/enoyl-CoA hydratase family protein [Mechercharimyces sp. CAU 1602]|uniref:3-hydroxyacyl-CoA dehydrogenase/enoyl-CoA hydratase family protein n=1 Tax=Mechercharimyces sp. CAU 1602 TaxID=2973933 RepID=UPI002161A330|nr:3-hydroxyacyl-CoA dehydrogenase/enoyl-CoA hydratase family protein [Mechercharimyces sp. CAU 1602]MCS1352056.1 3-hydroxyacyl-CoA dehydrogenase NAD-binding domain-containing protein [Mechercharimyces sp. CAU 1602]
MASIKRAAVIGSGVMGAAIAGHLSNVGIPTLLLDIVPRELTDKEEAKGLTLEDKVVRNRIAQTGKDRLFKEKPSPLYTKEMANLISVGNLEDDLNQLSEVDWIIEVVVENLKIKQDLFSKIEQVWTPGTIISSNTSGISINAMVSGRSDEFRAHFLGTHFFNPPRYMKLLEIIPTSATKSEIVEEMKAFAETRLGKGVVIAKDTPNFIANRIGVYGMQITLDIMKELELSPAEVDSVTGRAMGRPKSATFRTLDMVGLDTFLNVCQTVRDNVEDPAEREAFAASDVIQKMVDNGWLGSKSGQGFYKKVKGEKGKEIHALNLDTFEYEPRKKLKAQSLEMSKRAKTDAEKLQALVYGKDKAGELAWSLTKKVLLYAAARIPEIADDIVNVDQAMKWGFNWDMGPFEVWDAIGVEKSVAKMREEGETIPALVEELLASGKTSFYQKEDHRPLAFHLGGEYKGIEEHPKTISLPRLKEQGAVVKSNSGASLVDLGDGIGLIEFHSPKGAIGGDIISMLQYVAKEGYKQFDGLVIGNDAPNFCIGANLMLILMEAQDHNWPELDVMVRQFQTTMGAMRYLNIPVVAAPHGMTLGGGVETILPTDHIQYAGETYMGLVEVGVGLIPGGGGNKEMLYRLTKDIDPKNAVARQAAVNKAFETIAMAKVSTSGEEGRKHGFLKDSDSMSANTDHLIYDAKQAALSMAKRGYVAPQPMKLSVVGETGYNTLRLGAYNLLESGYISEHDYKIASKLAFVLAGGNLPEGTIVSEQYLLDLEREAFLSLAGEPKSQQRMMHMLSKNKPLRN